MRFGLSVGILVLSAAGFGSPEFAPIQDKAQGGSLTGASQLNDSLYTNPAASGFTQVYSVDGAFQLPKTFAVSILDTRTSGIGGAVGYFRKQSDVVAKPVQGAKLGFVGKVAEGLAFGAAGKVIWGPNNEGTDSNLKDIDTGILANYSAVQFGLVLRNTLGGDAKMDQGREWGSGVRVGWEDTVFLNVSTLSRWEQLAPYQYGIGAEYVSPYYFSLKAGYRTQPQARQSYWTGGLSFLSPRMSLHYAVEFPQMAGAKPEHVVGVTLLL